MIYLLQQILDEIHNIYDILMLHNKILRMLLEENIAKDEDKGIFNDMDEDIRRFFDEAMKKHE